MGAESVIVFRHLRGTHGEDRRSADRITVKELHHPQVAEQRDARAPDGREVRVAGYDLVSEPDPLRELIGSWRPSGGPVQMGLTRMTASVLTCLFTTDAGWLTAADLVQRLRVSPASVSKAIAYLESQGLVRRERDGRRGERYLVDDDVWLRAWQVSVQTNAVIAEAARSGAEILGPATPAGARLAVMSRFLRYVGRDMERSAEYWWELASSRGRLPPPQRDQGLV